MEVAGKHMLVTGATDGIGLQTAVELARLGAQVLLHGRTLAKVNQAVAQVQQAVPQAKVVPFAGDFSSLEEVRQLAAAVQLQFPALHVLLNNAGLFASKRQLTTDGLELTFQVNHLAPFLLTNLLLPQLVAASPARIVTVSSVAHQRGRIDFNDLQGKYGYQGYEAYAASKLANVLFTQELAERLKGTGVTANSLHPGVITTKLLKEGFGSTGSSVLEGAETSIYLATAEAVAAVSGKYFVRSQETSPGAAARDTSLQKQLWQLSAQLVGLAPTA